MAVDLSEPRPSEPRPIDPALVLNDVVDVAARAVELADEKLVLPKNRRWVEGMCSSLPVDLQGRLEPYCVALEQSR